MRQILTGYSIPSVWHQGGKICKWALCNFGPRSWIAAPPTLPCDGRSSLCQHNLQSESNTGRSGGTNKTFTRPGSEVSFFRSHRNALWIPRLASRPPLPRHLLIWQEVKGRRDVNDTFASSAASVLTALAASPLKRRRVRCLSRPVVVMHVGGQIRPTRPHPSGFFFPGGTGLSVHWTVPPECLKSDTSHGSLLISLSSAALVSHSCPTLPLTEPPSLFLLSLPL